MPRKKRKDWRSLPRKPAAALRTANISARVTAAEKREIDRRAKAAELTLRDYIVRRALGHDPDP